MLLRLEDMQYKRGLNFELRLNLNLKTGSRVLLRGGNGSGKTSLLNILAGIYPLSAGKLLHGLLPGNIAILGHECSLYPELTVRENLLFWLRIEAALLGGSRANLKEMADDALGRLKLTPLADELACKLSRGMLQRLALGRIFLSRANLILLDEPENGLDDQFFSLLMREMLLKSGATIVWASHNLPANYAFEGQQMFTHVLCLQAYLGFPGVFGGELQELNSTYLKNTDVAAPSDSSNVDGELPPFFPLLGDTLC